MGFDDEDFDTAKKALNETHYNGRDRSNLQLYKQAGNSIVVNVLEGVLRELFLVEHPCDKKQSSIGSILCKGGYMKESKPYDSTATEEQQQIILDFFKGYTVKQLVERYRNDDDNKVIGASGRKVMISQQAARLVIERALMHISWV